MRWSGLNGPLASHHSPASLANRATSSRSSMLLSRAGVMAKTLIHCGPGPQSVLKSRNFGRSLKGRPSCCVGGLPIARLNLEGLLSLLVLKFGGTSVADIDRIRNVAAHVKREVDAGHAIAVVVSAMAGHTNQLVAFVEQ